VIAASANSVLLNRRSLYMLPSRAGWLFAPAVAAMLLIAVNYNNGLAFLFTFFLAGAGVVSMLSTHRNVAGLEVLPGPCRPGFAGQSVTFSLWLRNPGPGARSAISVSVAGKEVACVAVAAGGETLVEFEQPAAKRGLLTMPAVTIASQFPLGLLFTWSRPVQTREACLVYPRPGPPVPFDQAPDRGRFQRAGALPEGDDFAGLRAFQRGDPPRHVHWKAAARGQGLWTKRFAGAGQTTVWFDFDALPALDTEARLSRLCRWVLDADRDRLRFGLRLPGRSIDPGAGHDHRVRCLGALARFGLDR